VVDVGETVGGAGRGDAVDPVVEFGDGGGGGGGGRCGCGHGSLLRGGKNHVNKLEERVLLLKGCSLFNARQLDRHEEEKKSGWPSGSMASI